MCVCLFSCAMLTCTYTCVFSRVLVCIHIFSLQFISRLEDESAFLLITIPSKSLGLSFFVGEFSYSFVSPFCSRRIEPVSNDFERFSRGE